MTVKQYLTGVRMEEASRLIRSGVYKMYQVGEMVGFSDYEYFRKQYKSYGRLA